MLSRLTNTPLMVLPSYADSVITLLGERSDIDVAIQSDTEMVDGPRYSARLPKEARAIVDGIAYIGVSGSLAHKSGRMSGTSSMMRSYTQIRADIDAALADPDVKGIVLDIDSPGGEAAGNFALAEYIASVIDQKPILGIADEHATSAAYNIGAAASRLIAPEGATVGSIGVIYAHVSEQRLLEASGIDVTVFRAGARKAEVNGVEELTEAATKTVQASIDKTYSRFVSIVAANRDVSEESVRGTESRVLDSDEALSLGLIDQVTDVHNAIDMFTEQSRDGFVNALHVPVTLSNEDSTMRADETGAAEGANVTENLLTEDDAKSRADAAALAERERVSAIHSLPEAGLSASHRELAAEFVDMGLSVEKAQSMLAKVPAPAAQEDNSGNDLDGLMTEHAGDVEGVSQTLTHGEEQSSDVKAALDAAMQYRTSREPHGNFAPLSDSIN